MNNKGKIKVESTAKTKQNPYKDDIIYSPMGQWQYPGQITRIPSSDISMHGVPYPVYGQDNLGHSQMMYPGGQYSFPGDYVTEYPQMAYGGTPKRGQIYDRLGVRHSISQYVPWAQHGGGGGGGHIGGGSPGGGHAQMSGSGSGPGIGPHPGGGPGMHHGFGRPGLAMGFGYWGSSHCPCGRTKSGKCKKCHEYQEGGPTPSYIAPPNYLMTNEDSSAYKTYFNRYLVGKAEDRANDLIKTPLREDLMSRELMNKLLVEKNAYMDAMRQQTKLANKKSGGPTAAKAAEMLHDGTAQGYPLTAKQKRYFGWLSHKEYGGSNTNNMSKNFKGRKGPFPQIQSADEFFSPAYWNIDSPYGNGSFKMGGFPTFSVFPTQPTKNEIADYGRPNWPYYFTQMGGNIPDGMSMGELPMYNYGSDYMNMGGEPCYECGGAHMQMGGGPPHMNPDTPWHPYTVYGDSDAVYMHPKPKIVPKNPGKTPTWGPDPHLRPKPIPAKPKPNPWGPFDKKSGGAAEINQGPEYFTNKMSQFTDHLRNTALSATEEEMNNQFMELGGTGYMEMFPYAEPYQYKKGGAKNWIQHAVNPAHKGYCTPMTKSTCTPRRKAFAMTMKKHHGFHQMGGQSDPQQEAKWMAILNLAQTGVTDPSQIADQLNQEGTYQTTPEEVQGYLEQVGSDEVEGQSQEEAPDYMTMGGYKSLQAGGPIADISKIYGTASTQGMQLAPQATPQLNFLDPNWSGATVTQRTRTAAPTDTSTGQAQIYSPDVQQKIAQRAGASSWGEYLAGPKADTATKAKFANYAGPTWGSPSAPVAMRQKGGDTKPYKSFANESDLKAYMYDQFRQPGYGMQSGYNYNYPAPAYGRSISEGAYRDYPMGYNQGYGYFPANAGTPYIKIKRPKLYINQGSGPELTAPKTPFLGSQAYAQPGNEHFQRPDGSWGHISERYGRGTLGLGANRLRSLDYEFGVGQRPEEHHSWVGDKLRKMTGNIDQYGTPLPSKLRKAEIAMRNQPPPAGSPMPTNQDIPGFPMSANYMPGSTFMSQDPALAPWLNSQPENVKAAMYPTESQPEFSGSQDPHYSDWRQTGIVDTNLPTDEYIKQVDAYLADLEKKHPSPYRNWFLGKKHYPPAQQKWGGYMQNGGNNQYIDLGPPGSQWDMAGIPESVQKSQKMAQQVSNQQSGYQPLQMDPNQNQNQGTPGGMYAKGKVKFKNPMDGESAANWGIAGMNALTNIFSQDERRNSKKYLDKQFKAENMFGSRKDRDRGDYTTNYGYFRPDQQNVGNMVTGKNGGQYNTGDEIEMSDEEIAQFLKMGGQIEYI